MHVLNAQLKIEQEDGKKFKAVGAKTCGTTQAYESGYQQKCAWSFDTKELFHFIGKFTLVIIIMSSSVKFVAFFMLVSVRKRSF